jgi:hypothetical protein
MGDLEFVWLSVSRPTPARIARIVVAGKALAALLLVSN